MFGRGCRGGFAQYIVVVVALCTVPGCAGFITETMRRPDASRASSVEPVEKAKPAPRRNATSPAPLDKKPVNDKRTQHAGVGRKPQSAATVPASDRKKARRPTLVRQLKNAAHELAKKHRPVRKMQLCHVAKDDEWWLFLYKDIGPVIDVRHFIWNWEKEKFAPFLVVKRIPKSKLSSHLNKKVPGRKCKILAPPSGEADDPVDLLWK